MLALLVLAGCLAPLDPIYSEDCPDEARWTVGVDGDFSSINEAIASPDVCTGHVVEIEQVGEGDDVIRLDRDIVLLGIDDITLTGNGFDPVIAMSAGTVQNVTITNGHPGVRMCRLDTDGSCLNIGPAVGGMVLREVTLSDNFNPGSEGGGVQILGPDVSALLDGVHLLSNDADLGGNLASLSADVTVQDSIVEFGVAEYDGGGLYNSGGGVLTVRNTVIRNNTAGTEGGGLHVQSAGVDLLDVVIRDNTCASHGCGAYLSLSGELNPQATNLVLTDNATTSPGGAHQLMLTGPITLTGAEIRGGTGGAAAVRLENAGFADFTNVIVAGNEGDGISLLEQSFNMYFSFRNVTVLRPGGDGIVVDVVDESVMVSNSFIGDADVGIRVLNTAGPVDRSFMAYWRNDTQYWNGTAADDTDNELTAEPAALLRFYHPDIEPVTDWDLHPVPGSPLIDAGDPDPVLNDSDGSRGDIGGYGGPAANRYWVEDADSDGMWNGWEAWYGLDPDDGSDADLDPDSDGWDNLTEWANGTLPDRADSDGDGCDEGTTGTDTAPVDPGVCL